MTIRRPLDVDPGNVGADLLAFSVPEWMELGLCAETDPAIFFPDKGESVKGAKKICAACSVRAECLAYAEENGELFGVWGGLSEYDRRKARRAAREVA